MTVTRLLLAVVPAAAVAAGNAVVLERLQPGASLACATCAAWLVASPLLVGVLLAFVLPRAGGAVATVVAAPPPTAPPPTDAALRLLGALQEAGRLVDFLEEDLSAYPDEQIGAAVRGIHEGCRQALHERITVEPVLQGAEGDPVTVDAGFDPAAIRLTGNVSGTPPFRGVLRHAGWRATAVVLPERAGQYARLIAPAEVELA